MNFIRRFTIAQRLSALIVLMAMGFAAYGGWSLYSLNDARVGGRNYESILQSRQLVADVLPPPLYIIEAHLAAMSLFTAPSGQAQGRLIDRLHTLEGEYVKHHAKWSGQTLGPELDTLIRSRMHEPALEFFRLTREAFLPALNRNDRAGMARALDMMNYHYELHRQVIDEVVVLAQQRAADTEFVTLAGIEHSILLQVLILAATVMLGVLVTVQIRRSINLPLQQALRSAHSVTAGKLSEEVMVEPFEDEPGQLLQALQHMRQSSRLPGQR